MFSKIKALKNITKLALIGGLFLTMTSYAAPKYVETDIVENKITAALFSVSLDPNGGTINNSTDPYRVVSNDTDKKVSFPTASKDHYDFKGYALPESDSATYDTPENGKLTGSIQQYNLPIKDDKGNSLNGTTLKAIFKPHAYNIKYILDTGKWRNEEQAGKTTYTCEDEAYTIPQPTKEGYTFTGWTSSNGSTPQTSFTIPKGSTGDISLTANWKADSHSITYILDGGNVSGNNPTSYTCEDSFTLINPTKDNYTFTGWSGTGINGTSMSVTVPKKQVVNRSYTAHWKANQVTSMVLASKASDFVGGNNRTANTDSQESYSATLRVNIKESDFVPGKQYYLYVESSYSYEGLPARLDVTVKGDGRYKCEYSRYNKGNAGQIVLRDIRNVDKIPISFTKVGAMVRKDNYCKIVTIEKEPTYTDIVFSTFIIGESDKGSDGSSYTITKVWIGT